MPMSDELRMVYEDELTRVQEHLKTAQQGLFNKIQEWPEKEKVAECWHFCMEFLAHSIAMSASVNVQLDKLTGTVDEINNLLAKLAAQGPDFDVPSTQNDTGR